MSRAVGPAAGGHGSAGGRAARDRLCPAGRRVVRGSGRGGVPSQSCLRRCRGGHPGQGDDRVPARPHPWPLLVGAGRSWRGSGRRSRTGGAEARRVDFGTTAEGARRLSALLPPDEGALVERALSAARHELVEDGEVERASWADALASMADRSLSEGAATRPHRDRHLVVVQLKGGEAGPQAHVHAGPPLPAALRRLLGCDGRVRPLTEVGGVPLSVGRAQRTVPERTRMAIEERDGACRCRVVSPAGGCTSTTSPTGKTAGLPTPTTSLPCAAATTASITSASWASWATPTTRTARCSPTPEAEISLAVADLHRPPETTDLNIVGEWSRPSGERLDCRWIHFNEPQPAA